MKRILLILLILFIAGILLLMSTYWSFDRENYVNDFVIEISQPLDDNVDVDYLKKEFGPAYGF